MSFYLDRSAEIVAVEHAVNLLVGKLSATYNEIDILLGLHDGYLRSSTTTTSSDTLTAQTTPSAATRSISSQNSRRGAADAVLFGHLMEATSHPLLRVLLDQRPHLQSFLRNMLRSCFLIPQSLSPPSWHAALQVLVSNQLFLVAVDEGPAKTALVNAAAAANHASVLSTGSDKKTNKSANTGTGGVNDDFAVTDIYGNNEESFASGVGDALRVQGIGSPIKTPAPAPTSNTLGITSKIPTSREIKQKPLVARTLSSTSPSSSPSSSSSLSSSSVATTLLPLMRDEPTTLCRALYLIIPLYSAKDINSNTIVLPTLPTPSGLIFTKPRGSPNNTSIPLATTAINATSTVSAGKASGVISTSTHDGSISIREGQQREAFVRWLVLGVDDPPSMADKRADKDYTTNTPSNKPINSTIACNKSEVAEVSLAGGLFALTAVGLFVREVILALLSSS